MAHVHGYMTTIMAAHLLCSCNGVFRVSDDYFLNEDGLRRYAGPPALNPLCIVQRSKELTLDFASSAFAGALYHRQSR